MSRQAAAKRAAALTALGKKMFSDPALSRSGRLSCASCHDPRNAFGPPETLAVKGVRAVPSLRYIQVTPPFSEHYYSSDRGDESVDNGPTGGLTWDGRVDRARDQARIPLLSPVEMANESPGAVAAKVLSSRYADEVRALAGNTFATVLEALETYQQDYRDFYPYSSRYDAFLAGKASLTKRESRGLSLFKNPAKGNCASCHPAERNSNGTPPQFTDYGLIALGVPRNPETTINDLGMCGPFRTDLRDRKDYCGRFMTPSLRNVATRHTFFHNGVFHTLKEAVTFYVERDAKPLKPDLPPEYRANLNTDPPFGKKLSETEIDDIVAFLKTLTDAN